MSDYIASSIDPENHRNNQDDNVSIFEETNPVHDSDRESTRKSQGTIYYANRDSIPRSQQTRKSSAVSFIHDNVHVNNSLANKRRNNILSESS